MSIENVYRPQGLYFAPMEGITDGAYRQVLQKAWPEWDYFCTDFLRIPRHGDYPAKKVLEHFGHSCFAAETLRHKTGYQVLASDITEVGPTLQIIQEYGFRHLDLNLGCPSKKVNSHRGGAFLLSDRSALERLVTRIRKEFRGIFTVKIRVGYLDDRDFEDNLRCLESCGVEAITIHGRTREELYKGRARWDYIQRAVDVCQIPIIGNGDVWTVDDIDEMFQQTGCHGIMIGRGALKTPWLATLYRKNIPHNEGFLIEERRRQLEVYFELLEKEYRKIPLSDEQILKRFKSLSRYLFDDFPEPEKVRGQFLRSESLDQFKDHLYEI